jgi:hypothetical protein
MGSELYLPGLEGFFFFFWFLLFFEFMMHCVNRSADFTPLIVGPSMDDRRCPVSPTTGRGLISTGLETERLFIEEWNHVDGLRFSIREQKFISNRREM